jgi:hypothetical protein
VSQISRISVYIPVSPTNLSVSLLDLFVSQLKSPSSPPDLSVFHQDLNISPSKLSVSPKNRAVSSRNLSVSRILDIHVFPSGLLYLSLIFLYLPGSSCISLECTPPGSPPSPPDLPVSCPNFAISPFIPVSPTDPGVLPELSVSHMRFSQIFLYLHIYSCISHESLCISLGSLCLPPESPSSPPDLSVLRQDLEISLSKLSVIPKNRAVSSMNLSVFLILDIHVSPWIFFYIP